MSLFLDMTTFIEGQIIEHKDCIWFPLPYLLKKLSGSTNLTALY